MKPSDGWSAGYKQGVEDAHRCVNASAEAAHMEWTRMTHALCSIFHAATMGVGNQTIADMARNALDIFAPEMPATKAEEIKAIDHILEKLKSRVREDECEQCAGVAQSCLDGRTAAERIRARRRQ